MPACLPARLPFCGNHMIRFCGGVWWWFTVRGAQFTVMVVLAQFFLPRGFTLDRCQGSCMLLWAEGMGEVTTGLSFVDPADLGVDVWKGSF